VSQRWQIEKDVKEALEPDTHIMPEIFQQLDFPFERLHLLQIVLAAFRFQENLLDGKLHSSIGTVCQVHLSKCPGS
jgi:hypothetical protein